MQFPFVIKGKTYKTPVHYYESQKFNDPITQQRIMQAQTARVATQISQSNSNLRLAKFDKNGIMLDALRAKFTQHPQIAAELKTTGNRALIYHTLDDDYWADAGDGSGENYLGKLLQEIRTQLLNNTLSTADPFMG